MTNQVTDYPADGGRRVVSTGPLGTGRTVLTYRDGSQKAVFGPSVADMSYDYGVHSLSGGGLWTQRVSTPNTQWMKVFRDALGRSIQTEYSDDATSKQSYHPATSKLGSRGKLASRQDADFTKEDSSGSFVAYTYNGEGELTKTTERFPPKASGEEPQTRVTLVERDVVLSETIHEFDLAPASRVTTSVNEVVTSTSWRSGDGYSSATRSFGNESLSVTTIPDDGAWTMTSTTPDGQETVATYTDGLLKRSEFFDNEEESVSYTTATHDAFGRIETQTDSRTGTVTYSGYTASGNLLGMTDAGQRETTYTYDALGRRLSVNAPDTGNPAGGVYTNITYTSYYPDGQTKATWGGQVYPRFYEYDEQNRMIALHTYPKVTGSEGTDTEEMDPDGADPEEAGSEVADSETTDSEEMDPGGTGPAETGSGEPSAPGTSITSWLYDDKRGWLNQKKDADGKGASYTYTPAGRLKTRTWARGVVTTYKHEEGSLVSVVYSDGTEDLKYSYDSFGRISEVAKGRNTSGAPLHQWNYEYSPTNLTLEKEIVSYDTDGNKLRDFTRIIRRGRDALLRQNLLELGTDTSPSSDYSLLSHFDSAGRLEQLKDSKRGNRFYTYTYHPKTVSQVQSISLAHRRSDSSFAKNKFDVTGRQWRELESDRNVISWTGLGYRSNNSGNRSRYDYTSNDLGQRIAVDTSGNLIPSSTGEWDWSYNSRGELVSADANWENAQSSFYEFDPIGNRNFVLTGTSSSSGGVKQEYAANSLNQYTNIPKFSASPEYDPDGNAIKYPMPTDPSNLAEMEWNGENRLTKVTRNDGVVVEFEYDYLGRRISKTSGDTASNWFVYDGWNPIMEYTQTSTEAPILERRLIWGLDLAGQSGGSAQGAGGVGGLLSIFDNGIDYLPAYDGNGNVTGLVKVNGAATGDGFTNVASYTYDSFGNLIDSQDLDDSGYVNENPFRFSTKYTDEETGLCYYGYRYYDPVTGRWPSRDPIEERGGLNLFGFVGNDGLRKIDLLGNMPTEVNKYEDPGTVPVLPDIFTFPVAAENRLAWADFGPAYVSVTLTAHEGGGNGNACCLEASIKLGPFKIYYNPNGNFQNFSGSEVFGHEREHIANYQTNVKDSVEKDLRAEQTCYETVEAATAKAAQLSTFYTDILALINAGEVAHIEGHGAPGAGEPGIIPPSPGFLDPPVPTPLF